MFRHATHRPLRRLATGVRAVGQGLLGVALIALAALAFLPSADAAAALAVEDQTFPGDTRVAGTPLQLNGVGLRAAFIYKVYLAALYLPAKAATGAEALAQPGPKRLQIRVLMDGSSDAFVRAVTSGVARGAPPERAAALARTLRGLGPVHKGDVVDLDCVPATGVSVAIDGRPAGAPVPGADLCAALLDGFVGEHAADARMKAGLLGTAS